MDIRKWFTSPKSNTTSSSNQSKIDTKSNQLEAEQKKDSKGSKKRRRIIESDSDEDPIPKEAKIPCNKKSPKKKEPTKTYVPEKQKEISVANFFGSAPISRSFKQEPPKTKKVKEDNIHEDDDFQATLAQLDEQKSLKQKKVNGKTKNPSETDDTKTQDKDITPIRTSPRKESKGSKHKDVTPSNSEMKDSSNKSKSSSSKRKTGRESLTKMEITPNPAKPKIEKIKIKEEKPVKKKPKGNGGNYASYLNREGPKALGSKEVPEGEEDCLAGLTFLITGVLESFERDEAKELIQSYGGKVMSTLSKNTKYIVIGRDAGSSKLAKAEALGTKQLDEDGLLDLIRTMPGKSGSGKKTKLSNGSKKSTPSPHRKESSNETNSAEKQSKDESDFDMDIGDEDLFDAELPTEDSISKVGKSESKSPAKDKPSTTKEEKKVVDSFTEEKKSVDIEKNVEKNDAPVAMWVDKYKPTSLKQIIGQQGDSSNAKKLLRWLMNWHKSRKLNKKPIPGRFNPSDDGSGFKAALLSGPPGVGKTTTTTLVCKEIGFDYFELNASDARSKKSLQQAVSQLLGNQTLANCFKDNGKVTNNHVIVMDEVDGMAGNEDRGGVGELIAFIKASKVPIICICNDRNHPKIRSLSNHCFDLRFQRPRVEQIKAAMLSIAFKEHIQVSPEVLQDVIVASNQDVRQVLHNMSMWSAKSKGLTSDQTKTDIGRGTKHIKMGPFDVLREVFAIGNNPKATIMDKSDLFFHDYSIAPLFVQENYVHVIPNAASGDKIKHLTLLSEAANSICIGDVIEKQIRSQSSWGLLPTQAIFSSVVPGELLKGHLRQMINFPAWLGKNSNRSHMDRVLQELHVHMRMKVTGNKTDIALEYLPLLKRALTTPLIEEEQAGVPKVLRTMEEYYLLREDFDSIIDLSLWSGQTDPRGKIQTKVKSAFTRAYNKESGKNPYAITNVKKKKGAAKEETLGLEDEDAVESEEEDTDSIEKDAMIKVKKPSKTAASGSSEPSTSKDKKKSTSSKRGKAK